MFLVTTADQCFWRTNEPVLFLGEWCKIFSQRHVWEKMDYQVLPYHWDDRKKLYQDYLYLDKIYEQVLLELVKNMNRIHDVDYSERYWRIIIGPWLSLFIQIFYDRYQSIIEAIECGKVTNALIGKYIKEQWVPKNHGEFQEWSKDDIYNQYLYSRIIEHTKKIPFDTVEIKNNTYKEFRKNNIRIFKFNLKSLLKYFIAESEKFTSNYFNRIVIISSYISNWDLAKLQLSLGQIPYLFPPYVETPESNINLELREKLSYSTSGNGFEELLSKTIREQIPSIYLEGYKQMNQISLNRYPKHPNAIINGIAYYSNEAFKFWAAYNVEKKIKLAGVQYGGLYGSGLWISTENHEIHIYDRFYTWGWRSENTDKTKPLPAAKLNIVRKNARPEKNGRLLMVLSTMPRYSYHMYSACVASSGTVAYFNDQYRFIKVLSEKNKKLLLVRLYQHDWGWDQKERFLSELPEIECYSGDKSMLDQLKKSCLFICTYNSTTFLETFVADFPTILFWNPNHWELRVSAKPYFDELRNVGILHNTPESAARKVNEISDDPVSWWKKKEIQEVKDRFCYQFARTSDDWLKDWKTELKSLAK